VTIGDDHHPFADGGQQHGLQFDGIQRGAVAGHEQHAFGALALGVHRAGLSRRALPLLVLVGDHRRPHVRGGRGGVAIVADHDDRADRRGGHERVEDVADHQRGQFPAAVVGHGRAEALLGQGEALDREDRGGAHEADVRRSATGSGLTERQREVEGLLRDTPSGWRVAHLNVGVQQGHIRHALIGHEAVDELRVVLGDSGHAHR